MIVETYRPGDFAAFLRTAQRRLRTYLDDAARHLPVAVRALLAVRLHPGLPQALGGRRPPDARRVDPARPVEKLERRRRRRRSPAWRSRRRRSTCRRVAPPMLDALRDQAGLQLHRRRTDELTRRLLEPENERGLGLLPPPSPGDLFFDMEGDPFFEAARRARVPVRRARPRPDGGTDYTAIRAHDRAGERKRLRGVHRPRPRAPRRAPRHARLPLRRLRALDALAAHGRPRHARGRGRRPAPPRGPRRPLPGRPPGPARRRPLLLAEGDRAVLLHPHGRCQARATTPSSSSSAGSTNGDEALLADIEAYNEEDCLATLELRDWLLVQRDRGRGRVRGRDPVPAAARAARGEEGVGRGALGDDPPQGRAARGGRTAATSAGSRRSSSTTTAARRARAGGGTSAGCEMTDEELDRRRRGDRRPRAGTERPPEVVRAVARVTFTFPPQQHHFDAGRHGGRPRRGRHRLDRHRDRQRRRHGRPQARQRRRATSASRRRSSPAARTTRRRSGRPFAASPAR